MEINDINCLMLPEILSQVYDFLEPKNLFICRQVCSFWHSLIENILIKRNEIECKWYQTHLKFHLNGFVLKNNFNIHFCDGNLVQTYFVSQLGITLVIKNVKYQYKLMCFNYLGEYFEQPLFEMNLCGNHNKIYISHPIEPVNGILFYVSTKPEKLLRLDDFKVVDGEDSALDNNLENFFKLDIFPSNGQLVFPIRKREKTSHFRVFRERMFGTISFSVTVDNQNWCLIDRHEFSNDGKTFLLKTRSDDQINSGFIMLTQDPIFTKYRHQFECYFFPNQDNSFPILCPETKRILISSSSVIPNSIKIIENDNDFNK